MDWRRSETGSFRLCVIILLMLLLNRCAGVTLQTCLFYCSSVNYVNNHGAVLDNLIGLAGN